MRNAGNLSSKCLNATRWCIVVKKCHKCINQGFICLLKLLDWGHGYKWRKLVFSERRKDYPLGIQFSHYRQAQSTGISRSMCASHGSSLVLSNSSCLKLSWMSATVMVTRACSGRLLWSALGSTSHWALLLWAASFSHMLFRYCSVPSLGGALVVLFPCNWVYTYLSGIPFQVAS